MHSSHLNLPHLNPTSSQSHDHQYTMLCATCELIFLDVRKLISTGKQCGPGCGSHHHTVEELRNAAAASCQICIQLFFNLQRHYWTIFTPDSTLSVLEKEGMMVREMMSSQESYLRDRDIPHVSDNLLTYLNFGSVNKIENEAILLDFFIGGHNFNTSRNTTGAAFAIYSQRFISLPSKRKCCRFLW
jgi:hypothetical protein